MTELQVFNFNQVDVVDSREVAKLVEKQHKNLLRDIDGYIETMRNSTELKIEPSSSVGRNFVLPAGNFPHPSWSGTIKRTRGTPPALCRKLTTP